MKVSRFFCALVPLVLTGSIACAESELEALRLRCLTQEERIRELESRLGISTPTTVHAPATAEAVESSYQVAAGDTLERIARKHDCPLAELLRINQLKADSVIHPGQSIRIPGSKAASSTPVQKARPTTASPSARTYLVTNGDTFSSIARAQGIPVDDLVAANPEIKPTALQPGQTIRLGSEPTSPEQLADEPQAAEPQSPILVSLVTAEPVRRIRPVQTDRDMTYREFAILQGTTTRRLNQLNGLDLIDAAKLVKGTELLAPVIVP